MTWLSHSLHTATGHTTVHTRDIPLGNSRSNGAGGVQGFSLEQVVFRVLAWSNGAGGVQGFSLEQVVFRVLAWSNGAAF